MQDLMDCIFGDVLNNYHATFIPDIYYVILDDSRRVSIHFYSTNSNNYYNAISLAITDKYTGIVCKRTVMFKDILEGVDEFQFLGCGVTWYKGLKEVVLSEEDRRRMRSLLDNYLKLWT